MEPVRKDIVRVQKGVHSYITSRKKTRQRRPVLLLHGAGGGAWYWEEMLNFIVSAGGYPCYAPDLPGHGVRSDENIINMSILAYVEYLVDFIENVIRPAHGGLLPIIIGHSMGGLITQKLAERGYAHKIVLLAPAPPKGVRLIFGRDFRVPIRDHFAAIRSTTTLTPFRPSKKLVTSLFINPKDNRVMIERCIVQRLNESPRALYELLNSRIAIDRKLVQVPMLIIGFIQDHIITEHVVRRIALYYGAVAREDGPRPDRELHIRSDLGHLCPLEAGWESVARECLNWIG